MADVNAPLFRYSRSGFTFEVYANRIEITDTSGFGSKMSGGKQQVIPIRSVSSVTVEGMARRLFITTNDGRRQEFNLGGDAAKARQAIMGLL
jgi:hypothetical protein